MSLRIQGTLHEDAKVFFIDEITNKVIRVVNLTAGPIDEQWLSTKGLKCHILALRASDGKPVGYGDITGIFQQDTVYNIINDADDGFFFNTNHYYTQNFHLGEYSGLDIVLSYLRFIDVTILKDTVLSAAYLKLLPIWTSATVGPTYRIYGIADPMPEVTDRTQLEAMTPTTAYVDWTIPATTVDVQITSPDISAIVNEIVAGDNWSLSQSLGFRFEWQSTFVEKSFVNLTSELHVAE